MIYIIMFLLSLLCINISIMTSKQNKIISRIFEITGILLPCLLAAFRDITIGTDVEVYVNPLFIAAQRKTTFLSFYSSMNGVTDFLYLLVTYMCSRISKNIGILFFTLEILIVTPIYVALKKKFKNSKCLLLGMLLFYLFFYNQSYNMVRQSIAIAFIILGLSFLDENKTKSFLLCFLIACLFHNTAMIFIILFLLYKLISSKKISKEMKFLIEMTIIIGATTSIFFLPKLIKIAGNLGIIDSIKSELYTTKYLRSDLDFSYVNSFIYGYTILMIFLNKKVIQKDEENYKYYIFSGILSFIILQFGVIISFVERIGYYLFYPLLITILPYIIKTEEKRLTKNNFYILVMTIIVFIVYWIYWTCILRYNATYPYIFR